MRAKRGKRRQQKRRLREESRRGETKNPPEGGLRAREATRSAPFSAKVVHEPQCRRSIGLHARGRVTVAGQRRTFTGLPPLCAAHPGDWRTCTEPYAIVNRSKQARL
ncbi:hypothetical protein ARMA_2394 [Ardenticatena maritima]|uniref:Uncharacterized protein n=1 Tax=Ardenticatena maritima TaxID=872965 RepID=A0A0M8KA33_9CHLR|nr:hypothetical protein ARMA_2394 [Ardenticatena maritima]